MLIRIANVSDNLPLEDRSDLTFVESEQVVGDLEITFDAGSDVFRRAGMNLPLFVAETRLFLERTKAQGRGTWKMYFAPFLDGLMDGQDLVIVRGTGSSETKVLERLPPARLSEIESLLSSLADRYGRLKPSPEAHLQSG